MGLTKTQKLDRDTITHLIEQTEAQDGWRVSVRSPNHFIASRDGVLLDVSCYAGALFAERLTLDNTTDSSDQVVAWLEDAAS